VTKTKTVLLTLALPAMFHAAPGAHAQMVVAAPILETILVETRAGQVIQHAQMMGEHARSAATIYSQLQTARRMYEMARNNVSRINDVRSWDDFMRWYNRQLALEQMTVRQLDRTGIRIGGQTYGLRQIMEIPRAMGARHAEIDDAADQFAGGLVGISLVYFVQSVALGDHFVEQKLTRLVQRGQQRNVAFGVAGSKHGAAQRFIHQYEVLQCDRDRIQPR